MRRISYPGILLCLLAGFTPALPQVHAHHDRCLLSALSRSSTEARLRTALADPPSGEEEDDASSPGEVPEGEPPEPAKEERGTRRRSFLRSRTGTIVLVVAGTLVAGSLARRSLDE